MVGPACLCGWQHKLDSAVNLSAQVADSSGSTHSEHLHVAVKLPWPCCHSAQAAGPCGSGTSGLPPHVYAIATSAYRQMMRDGAGQAILVSGQQGGILWRARRHKIPPTRLPTLAKYLLLVPVMWTGSAIGCQ